MVRRILPRFRWLTLGVSCSLLVSLALAVQSPEPADVLQRADALQKDGNSADAAKLYRQILSNDAADTESVVAALQGVQNCVQRLNEVHKIDADLASALEGRRSSYKVLDKAADVLMSTEHYGSIANQEFTRGYNRGYSGRGGFIGQGINVTEQDRLQILKWRTQAMELADQDLPEDAPELAELNWKLAQAILFNRQQRSAWMLQQKTDLSSEPDYLDDSVSQNIPSRFAPTDEDGNPIFYDLPQEFADATSDGQRMRWAFEQATKAPKFEVASKLQWASFLESQFSVQTLSGDSWILRAGGAVDETDQDAESARFALHTLGEQETVARLASGVKRFALPDDQSPIAIYRGLIEQDHIRQASMPLANIFMNRRQYPEAAEVLQMDPRSTHQDSYTRKLLDNILEARLRFDPVPTQLPGEDAQVSLVFRNAERIDFIAHRVDLEKLLRETKQYYRNFRTGQQPQEFAPGLQQPPGLSRPVSLFDGQLDAYLLDEATEWSEAVEPRPNHWDRRQFFQLPIENSGLYVLQAKDAGGQHEARTLVWLQDTIIVRKPLDGTWLTTVADAATGRPIEGANVEFFGVGYLRQKDSQPSWTTRNVARLTNANGQVEVDFEDGLQWLSIARTKDGRLAIDDLQRFWQSQYQRQNYIEVKGYGVADRPVYRPGDTVKAKFWIARPTYGTEKPVAIASANIEINVVDAQGNQVTTRQLQTDQFGACDFEFDLSRDTGLGRYSFQVNLVDKGGARRGIASTSSFRVEEYRKPEFEVEVLAPNKPVALGETVDARIKATYYFGAPVAGASATVRVERSTFKDSYFPSGRFDWCYGPGYWWFNEDYLWYPGFRGWCGCFAPYPWWEGSYRYEPAELVLEQELTLDATGEATVAIDTAIAKMLYGEEDHKYSISVEVRDNSRRTITASGSVIASPDAFKVYTWTDRGYYTVGQPITVELEAKQLDGTPVEASGELQLLRINYEADGTPVERVVQTWPLQTDEQGRASQQANAQQAGQYRWRAVLVDDADHRVEGGYIFTVRGPGMAGDQFRFNALELTPDKREYQPGDTVRLNVAADHEDATVWLFVRPENGVYQRPQKVQLNAKSAVVEIEVTASDQPNFFVEAFTVYDGQLHQQTREIFVPPVDRVLTVDIQTDKPEYLPGEEAEVNVTVRDLEDNPVQGSVLISAFDRSLEQIAPDTLPTDIREFFWKWRRSHRSSVFSNATRYGYPINIKNVEAMMHLGIYGYSLADDLDAIDGVDDERLAQNPSPGGMGGAYGGGMGGYGGGMGGGVQMMRGGMGGGYGATMEMAAPASAMMGDAAGKAMGGGAEPSTTPTVRKDFADSAVWLTSVDVGADGRATAKFKMPESLTSWRVGSWAVGRNVAVGSASTSVVTAKPLLVRLQTPRFLVQGDEAVISTIVLNDFDTMQTTQVRLEIDGETQAEFAAGQQVSQSVEIPPGEQRRVDWRIRAVAEGEIAFTTYAQSQDGSDAMQRKLPIVVNGILKTESYAGTVRDQTDSSKVQLTIPEQRRVAQSKLTVRVSPSLAAAMLEALPYLAEYPYGCTEQTLNRFLPTVITQKVLIDQGLDLQQLKQRTTNLNAQELGDPAERNSQWKAFNREAVFDQAIVRDMVQSGVQRLTDMQCGDGGWGWFSGPMETSSAHTTATVVRGLLIAQQNGVAIVPDVLQRGLDWLENYQNGTLVQLKKPEGESGRKPFVDNTDALVFHVLTLADRKNGEMQAFLYKQRDKLSVYGKALFAWATHRLGDVEQTSMLRRNLEQFLVQDLENETAFLKNDFRWWYWYGSEIEANAIYLKLLAAVEPKGVTAPRVVKYLLNNRKHAAYWNSTRDTALVVEAFGDYLAATEETQAGMSVEVLLGGKRLGRIEFTPENLFTVDNEIEIVGSAVPPGTQELEIRRTGGGNLYWNAYATNFTLEPEIEAAGLEVKVNRNYYRLDPVQKDLVLPDATANAVETKQAGYDRTRIEDLAAVPSGTLIEVELLVESKNDYEYLMLEDRKAACLETVENQSGYFYSSGLMIFRELRDQHVALFIKSLPRGNYSIRYQFRSETPGTFTALPATLQGMYAPELVGNSRDTDFQVVE